MDLHKRKACIAILIAILSKKSVKRKRWVKNWLQRRNDFTHLSLLNEIRNDNEEEDFQYYYRMKEACFDQLLQMVKPYLTKQDTCMRKSISAEEKLAVTLRYLATGRNISDLKYSVIMSPAAISQAIMDTCQALLHVLQSYIKMPASEEEWKDIAREFGERYQFWNCTGALDGKHVQIQKPPHSGSLYYNYKGHFSIVLMALANAKKEFIMIDVGANGRVSDGGVLFYTKFWELYQQGRLFLPEASTLPGTSETFPYVFIGDEAFALGTNLMKPYPQNACNSERKKFNYQLSRARSVIECAFGILRSKFGVFQKNINFEPSKVALIVATCCYLHNYLIKTSPKQYLTSSWNVEKQNGEQLLDLEPTHNRNPPRDAKAIREQFCHYFNNTL
ncbi:hypothetical protein ABMA27_000863 [Loxostege sticticalis]|uniref:DDE Tnp4 domain-containing protein n=1 Tax=Loxostege sticticalis TaxID=481309 RepID=A0ABR3I0M0_LOXSC